MPTTHNRIANLLKKTRDDGLTGQLVRGALGSIAIKVTGIMIGVALTIVLARMLGPEGYGTYAYIFAIISILAIPAQLGIPRLVIRETAKAQLKKDWCLIRGLWRWATLVVLILSAMLVCAAAGVTWAWGSDLGGSDGILRTTLFFALLLIPLIALGNLRGAALQGLRHIVWGQFPEQVVRPGLFVLLLLASTWWSTSSLTPSDAMGLHVFASGAAVIFGALLLHYSRPTPLLLKPTPVYRPRLWIKATLPLALTAGMVQINQHTDLIMLRFFLTSDSVGIYRVATQSAAIVVFAQQTAGMLAPPYYARLYAEGDMKRLQRFVTVNARIAFSTALPLVLIFLLFGEEIISYLFGPDYEGAYTPLLILAVGQLINTLFGHVGMLLNMTGHERDTAKGMAIAAILNVTLTFIFIPLWGTSGAAIATALTLFLRNYVLWKILDKRISIRSEAFFNNRL
ncbi:MAG: flippase [Gammaproteobacteria bacterium]|nr:MAG: flippase [Gammaproteobacteria bacterium]